MRRGEKYQPVINWLFIWNFMINLLNTGIREALHSAEFGIPSNETKYGIGAVVVFAIGLLLQLLSLCYYIYKFLCLLCKRNDIEMKKKSESEKIEERKELEESERKELEESERKELEERKEKNKELVFTVFVVVQTLLVSVCYYIGDNLYPTLREYGDDVGCDEECVMKSQVASLGFLSIASLMLYFSKDAYESILKMLSLDKKDEKPFYYKITNFVVTVVKIDIIYTTVIGIGSAYDLTNTDEEYCQDQSKAYALTVLIVCFIIGAFLTILKGFEIWLEVKQLNQASAFEKRLRKRLLILLVVCFLIGLVSLIFSDNHLPLDFSLCYLNSTCSNTTCLEYRQAKLHISTTRSALSFIVLAAVVGFLAMTRFLYIAHTGQVHDSNIITADRQLVFSNFVLLEQESASTTTQESASTPTQESASTPTQESASTTTQESASTTTQESASTTTQESPSITYI